MLGILIADNSKFSRILLTRILEQAGYQIVGEAANGLEAVNKYFQLMPEILMMDITMPIINGIQAVNMIKAKDPAASIILCSSQGQSNTVRNAFLSGAKDFIVKPFDPKRIVQSINKLKDLNYVN